MFYGDDSMYGKFDNFPETVQTWALIAYSSKIHQVQSILIETLWKLNSNSEEAVEHISKSSGPVWCRYEVGVADGMCFNFIDEEEVLKLREKLEGESYKILDTLICTSYYYATKDGKKTKLRSDLQYLRFTFEALDYFEVYVHHFRGPRWMPLDELIRRIFNRLNDEAKRRRLPLLSIVRLEGH
ncbi:MAG: hypothetical protein QXJ75_05240 [Candidatus Bathyarchaeia archaeon]